MSDSPKAKAPVDVAAHEYASKKLKEEHLALVKSVDSLGRENDVLHESNESLKKSVSEGKAEVKKVDDAKRAAKKEHSVAIADGEKKVADQRGLLKAEKEAYDQDISAAKKEEKKAYDKVKDIEKSVMDVQATRGKVKKIEKKLKEDGKDCARRSAALKVAEGEIAKRETAVLSVESSAANAARKVVSRELGVTMREEALRESIKAHAEKESSLNTQIKGLEGYREKVMKEHKRADTYCQLIDEAKRIITSVSYTEEDTPYKHLDPEQAKKVDQVVGDYIELLESIYKYAEPMEKKPEPKVEKKEGPKAEKKDS